AHNYTPDTWGCAFYPLWPFLLRGVSYVFGKNLLLTGYVLSNLFSLAALLLFHRYGREKHGLQLADRATILLALFPGSVFFFLPYTESLFLFLVVFFFWSLHRCNYAAAAAAAFFLPMTRAVGVLIFPCFLWELFRRKASVKNYGWAGAPLLGYACYFGIMHLSTGNALSGFEAQQHFPTQPSLGRLLELHRFAEHFAEFHFSHEMLYSALDRILFLCFLVSLYWVFRLDSGYYLYAVLMGLVPALAVSLMSYTRFCSVIFPLFIVMAQLLSKTRGFWLMAAVFGAAQFYFLLRHISGQWAG
ncbi:MAG TPA: hypothetical protein VGF13_20220, partial [Verrucomicrobiae bacterium]